MKKQIAAMVLASVLAIMPLTEVLAQEAVQQFPNNFDNRTEWENWRANNNWRGRGFCIDVDGNWVNGLSWDANGNWIGGGPCWDADGNWIGQLCWDTDGNWVGRGACWNADGNWNGGGPRWDSNGSRQNFAGRGRGRMWS